MDAIEGTVAYTDSGKIFHHNSTDEESRKYINWLELRLARLALLQLISPDDVVRLHLNKIMAIALIRKMG